MHNMLPRSTRRRSASCTFFVIFCCYSVINKRKQHRSGIGTKKDVAKGIEWLRAAANKNNREAQAKLGEILIAENQINDGLHWLNKAAEQEHPGALVITGRMWLGGLHCFFS